MNAESPESAGVRRTFANKNNKRTPDADSILPNPPKECRPCGSSRNCINGLYCTERERYVQHDHFPACGTGK